jgi:GTP cyclohydrolase I
MEAERAGAQLHLAEGRTSEVAVAHWKSPLVYLVRNGKTVVNREEVPLEEPKVVDIVGPLTGSTYKIPIAPGIGEWDLSTIDPEVLADALLRRLTSTYEPNKDHSRDTARRWVASMRELVTPEPFNFTTFPATSDEMIVLGPMPFYTMCAHHVIPFYGQAYIGYVPKDSIAGLSKFARLVKNMAKGLWVQEELTGAIADGIEAELEPRGAAVVLEGEHMCMSMRGVQMPGVVTTTSSMRGVFGDHERTAKAEFLQIIAPRRKTSG